MTSTELFEMLRKGQLTPLAKAFFVVKEARYDKNSYYDEEYLYDGDHNVLMKNSDGLLDLWLHTTFEGKEGFIRDLINILDELCKEDKEYIEDLIPHAI